MNKYSSFTFSFCFCLQELIYSYEFFSNSVRFLRFWGNFGIFCENIKFSRCLLTFIHIYGKIPVVLRQFSLNNALFLLFFYQNYKIFSKKCQINAFFLINSKKKANSQRTGISLIERQKEREREGQLRPWSTWRESNPRPLGGSQLFFR